MKRDGPGAGREREVRGGFFFLIMKRIEWCLDAAGFSASPSTPDRPDTLVSHLGHRG